MASSLSFSGRFERVGTLVVGNIAKQLQPEALMWRHRHRRRLCVHYPVQHLGPEFHGELVFWRRFVDKGDDVRGGVLSARPMCHLLERPAQRTLISDASKSAIGGYCLQPGVYRRCDFTTCTAAESLVELCQRSRPLRRVCVFWIDRVIRQGYRYYFSTFVFLNDGAPYPTPVPALINDY